MQSDIAHRIKHNFIGNSISNKICNNMVEKSLHLKLIYFGRGGGGLVQCKMWKWLEMTRSELNLLQFQEMMEVL